MAKRSSFPRRASDKYLTPFEATVPLVPFLTPGSTFIEPCAGDGRLVRHLERHGLICVGSFDKEPDSLFVRHGDALVDDLPACDVVVTNFPWTRELMHPLIDRMMRHAPTWCIHDSDWAHTVYKRLPITVPDLMKHCSHILAIGRVRWIDDTTKKGKDNVCWYRFDINHTTGPKFYPRTG